MEKEIEQPAAVEADEQETSEEELVDTTDWKAEALKARRIASRYRNKVTKLTETKVEPESKTQETAKPEDNGLLKKAFLRSAGITHAEDVELAISTAKKWGMDVDALVDDPDFRVKLERQQTERSNALATSNLKGGSGDQSAKSTPEYWKAKGTPPTPQDVPDRKLRAKIIRGMMDSEKGRGKFYNED